MRNIIKTLAGLSLGALALTACKKEVEKPSDSNDYFPLKVGKYILYDVDSVVYDDLTKTTHINSYQMRYEVVDSFKDNANRVSYTINVYQRPETDEPFIPRDVIHVTKTATGMEWTQSNAKILKMAFPIDKSTSWNGMAFIQLREEEMDEYNTQRYSWNFSYDSIGVDFDPGNNPFYNTITVNGIDEATNQPDDSVYADRNFYREKYAAGIGMVYRERVYWVYNPSTALYKKGYELRMRAVEQN